MNVFRAALLAVAMVVGLAIWTAQESQWESAEWSNDGPALISIDFPPPPDEEPIEPEPEDPAPV